MQWSAGGTSLVDSRGCTYIELILHQTLSVSPYGYARSVVTIRLGMISYYYLFPLLVRFCVAIVRVLLHLKKWINVLDVASSLLFVMYSLPGC